MDRFFLAALVLTTGCGFEFDLDGRCFQGEPCADDVRSTDDIMSSEVTPEPPDSEVELIDTGPDLTDVPTDGSPDADPNTLDAFVAAEVDAPLPADIFGVDETVDAPEVAGDIYQAPDDTPEVLDTPEPEDAPACQTNDDCDDDNPCTLDLYVTGFGCVYDAKSKNASACDDGNSCTAEDTCDTAGNCVGHSPIQCTAIDQCHDVGTCQPETGKCTNPEKENGTPCEDGLVCTDNDSCLGGVCQAGGPHCVPDSCHSISLCDESTGLCTQPSTSTVCQPDNDGCTYDLCDLKTGCYGINIGRLPGSLGGCGANPPGALAEDFDGDGFPNFIDEDDDGDGIGDGQDNAPRVANEDQADTDGDGIGDVIDSDADGDGECDSTWPGPPLGYCGLPPSP